jgi:transcriptional regulator
MPTSPDLELLQGTVDLLILKTLSWGPRHGYAISRWIKDTSGDAFGVEDRALYLALHRLDERGLVESDWGVSENNRRARFYQITRDGKRQLTQRASHWTRYADAMARVLRAGPQTGAA